MGHNVGVSRNLTGRRRCESTAHEDVNEPMLCLWLTTPPSSLSLSTISAGLCPDWAAWDPNQPVENAREAMQQADDWLGVPQVHWVCKDVGENHVAR